MCIRDSFWEDRCNTVHPSGEVGRHRMDRRHALASRVERDLADPGEQALEIRLRYGQLCCGKDKSCLGRITEGAVSTLGHRECRVVAERPGCERRLELSLIHI